VAQEPARLSRQWAAFVQGWQLGLPAGRLKEPSREAQLGISGLNLGMPSSSFADPEYVGQQKMLKSMTTAYNWIALNSAKFASGCKDSKGFTEDRAYYS